MRFILHWLTIAIALWLTSYLLGGVVVQGWNALILGSLVLGLVNALVRPILQFLALPITVLTLGIFYLVVNGISFGIAAWLVPGFEVGGLWSATIGALVFAIISTVLGWFLRPKKDERR